MKPFENAVLPPGICSRFVDQINGLKVHILEAGFDAPGRQLVLMLHGFPEHAKADKVTLTAAAQADGRPRITGAMWDDALVMHPNEI